MRANSAVALARNTSRPAPRTPPTAAQVDLVLVQHGVDERARELYTTVSKPVVKFFGTSPLRWAVYRLLRADNPSRPLTLVARDITMYWLAGRSEAQVRRLVSFLEDYVDQLYGGGPPRDLAALDIEEGRCEARENETSLLLRLPGGETPARLRQAADADRREAHVSLERARARESRALELETQPATSWRLAS